MPFISTFLFTSKMLASYARFEYSSFDGTLKANGGESVREEGKRYPWRVNLEDMTQPAELIQCWEQLCTSAWTLLIPERCLLDWDGVMRTDDSKSGYGAYTWCRWCIV